MMTVASANYSRLPTAAVSQLSGAIADNGSCGQVSALPVSTESKKTSGSLALKQEIAVETTGVQQLTDAVSGNVEDDVRLIAGGERRRLLSSTSYWSRYHQLPKASLSSSSTSGSGYSSDAAWKHHVFGSGKACGQHVPLDLSNAATAATLRNERKSDVTVSATTDDQPMTGQENDDDQALDLRTTFRSRSPFPHESIPQAKIINSFPSRDVQQTITYGFHLVGNCQSRAPATLACGEPNGLRPSAILYNVCSRQLPFTSTLSAINGGVMMTKAVADDKATTTSLEADDKVEAGGDCRNRCGLCQKTFADSSNVKRHMLTHSSTKPYHCSYCSKGFRQNSHLVEHTRIHTGEKPYSCVQCGKLFSHNRNWRRHLRTHSASDSFRCTVCGKLFCESYQLKVHERLHTGDKPYRCTVCDRAFRRRSNLTAHSRIHQRGKPTCGICGEIFNQSNHLNSHLRSHALDSTSTCS